MLWLIGILAIVLVIIYISFTLTKYQVIDLRQKITFPTSHYEHVHCLQEQILMTWYVRDKFIVYRSFRIQDKYWHEYFSYSYLTGNREHFIQNKDRLTIQYTTDGFWHSEYLVATNTRPYKLHGRQGYHKSCAQYSARNLLSLDTSPNNITIDHQWGNDIVSFSALEDLARNKKTRLKLNHINESFKRKPSFG